MERTLAALLMAALGGALFLAVPGGLLTAASNPNTSSEGRGDNPVVGSLPCVIDEDELGLKFWKWVGGNFSGPIAYQVPTLAMVGDTDLDDYIVDLWGTPDGLVNAASDFTAVGSVQGMTLTADRASAVVHEYRVVLWLPSSYLGGTVQMNSTLGNSSWTLGNNAFAIPVATLCAGPGAFQSATITVTPPGDTVGVTVQVDVVAGMLVVDFQP